MNLNRILPLLLAAGFSGTGICASVPGDLGLVREQFRAALLAVELRQPLPPLTPELRQYPLFPYLSAQQLRQSLEPQFADSDNAVAEFLKVYGDQPMTRPLRREWLINLAQREQWPRFLTEVPADSGDVNLQCSRFTGLLKTGSGAELVPEVLAIWLTGDSRPQSCVFPFDWLKQQGELTEVRRLRRARLALEAGNLDLADFMISTLPADQVKSLQREVSLLRDPSRELPRLVTLPDPTIPVESVLVGWGKLIRSQPEQAESLLRPLLQAQQINAAKAGEFIRQLALGYSWNRDPRCLQYFLAVPEGTQNESSYEWRARAALWSGDWKLALDWIKSMPVELAAQPRWRYWLARALEQNSGNAAAQKIYLSLLDANNYYAILAAVRLQAPLIPKPQLAALPDPALRARLAAHPALVRSREWYLLGRQDQARSEWNFALDGSDKPALIEAARIASDWGWQQLAIGTAARAAVFDDFALLYPEPYAPQVKAGAELAGLPMAWIYGVIRQESLYDANAVSRRDAYGLMQLLLPTARSTAQRWKLPLPTREDLFVPEVNVRLGAAHLREVTDKFGGRFLLALGAYNAGATSVTRWLPPQPMDADIWIENIPFNETRAYVQKILWHVAVFGWRETGKAQELSPLLQPVGGLVTAP